jgi:hypothetical protein
VQNPHGEYRLHGLTRAIRGSARAFHRTLLAAVQNLTPDGVLRTRWSFAQAQALSVMSPEELAAAIVLLYSSAGI